MEAPPVIGFDIAQLKSFAEEAEDQRDYDLAAKHHQVCIWRRLQPRSRPQDLIAMNRTDVGNWFDYGTFCMRVGDASKAEECFRQVVSLEQQHEHALILLGVLALAEERFEEARHCPRTPQPVTVCRQRSLLRRQQDCTESRLCRGSFSACATARCDSRAAPPHITTAQIGNELRAEMSLTEAHNASKDADKGSIFIQTAEFLLTVNATELADKCGRTQACRALTPRAQDTGARAGVWWQDGHVLPAAGPAAPQVVAAQ